MAIVSFFDQFPEFEGVRIEVRGQDGYLDASQMSKAMEAFDGKKRRFNNWTRTDFTKRLLNRLSARTNIPITWEDSRCSDLSSSQKPLIDYVRGNKSRIWLHPYVAMSYSMSVPEFQAEVNIWIVDLMTLGTVNPHILKWTQDEYLRGVEFNRDDITDMYGARN
jgi:hypothetical protein